MLYAHPFQMLPTSNSCLTAHTQISDHKEIDMRLTPIVLCSIFALLGCSSPHNLNSSLYSRQSGSASIWPTPWPCTNGTTVCRSRLPRANKRFCSRLRLRRRITACLPHEQQPFCRPDRSQQDDPVRPDRPLDGTGEAPPQQVRDLAHELRPRLDMLQATLLSELGNLDRAPLNDCPHHLSDA